jgi:hypothetical protein
MGARTALAVANARYWTLVAPRARAQLARWEPRAHAIPECAARELALAKLAGEHFNARAGAILATLAPRARRSRVVEAIVALQVCFDYLDGLTERPSLDPLGEGERLFAAFTSVFDFGGSGPAGFDGGDSDGTNVRQGHVEGMGAGEGYLWELSRAVRSALADLPALAAVSAQAREAAVRGAQAQTRMHAVPRIGTAQLESWAGEQAQRVESHASGGGDGPVGERRTPVGGVADAHPLGWREILAGSASSVLVAHALVVAAADPATTAADAHNIAHAYLSVCVVLTLLDSLVDRDEDSREGRLGFIGLYDTREQLTDALARVVARARAQTSELPYGAHHLAMLCGVVAFYGTEPGAGSEFARPVFDAIHEELRPDLAPAMAVMRAWRAARRVR